MNANTRRLTAAVSLFVLLVLIAALQPGCRHEPIVSRWTTDSIRVDGLSRDWDKLPRTIIENPRASFGVSNDGHKLYVLLHANDQELVRKLTQQGITLWFDAAGKKHKTFGISYRGNRMPGMELGKEPFSPRGHEAGRRMRGDSLPDGFEPPAPEKLAVLEGSVRNRIPIRAQDARVPAAESRAEGAGITYEFSVPLSYGDGEFAIGLEPGATFSMGVEFGQAMRGMKPGNGGPREHGEGESGQGGRGHGPGDSGGMGGGGRGGGMQGGRDSGGNMPPGGGGPGGGGGRPGSPQGEQGSSEKREVWFKVLLSRGEPSPQ